MIAQEMKRLLTAFFLIPAALCAFAQESDPVLVKVGNESVTKSEFLKAYQKNNLLSEATEKDLREYLDLYANYRMKVQEAQAQKMDTSAAFVRELASYRNQSAQQYLVDSEVSDRLLNEAYDRFKYQVRASHILVQCSQTASPKDTLEAWNKIVQIRNRVLKGMDFGEAASEFSEDPSARDFVNPQTGRMQRGNHGDLGYFSVLEMIYPFETAAYNTPAGQISMPVRTRFGYHLIKVDEKVPAMAQIFVSQIFVADTLALAQGSPEALAKVREIARRLRNGQSSFENLAAELSEDQATKDKGGKMLPFAPGRRPGNYTAAAIHLQPGDVSDPVPSVLGWHFLRLDSIKYVTVNDETKYLLKSRLARDERARKGQESMVAKLKNEYHFNESGKKAVMKFFNKNIPDNYFSSDKMELAELKGIEKLKPMCTFADVSLSAVEFAKFISRYQGITLKGTISEFLEQLYTKFTNERILRYEKTQLANKYPEYRDLVNEFHDGMMLYEINSQKVWNAAIQDSIGLERLYQEMKEEFKTTDSAGNVVYKPLDDVKAVVINRYQEMLEKQWLEELHAKYPVVTDEKVFRSILSKQ